MQAGDEIDFQDFPEITRAQLKAYADASGDFNPIHQDDEAARQLGLPGVIAHGMLSSALIAERAMRFASSTPELSGAGFSGYKTRFKGMTFPGDVLSIGGTVKSVSATEWVLELQARNQKGEITTTAEARFLTR